MITKQYNLVNNIGGWFIFLIALATYWLTLEPTASYWDCGEFILQGQKLEVGHPPGNPIFMLTARFFANFAPSVETVSVMINAMSGLLSALTILILFWTITHLVRRLVVKDSRTEELSLQQYLIIMGSGAVGALAYCWSDTFWFSAVESEVYAFSSFCTALVFWLILKWENRADQPHSDRYLILIAYVIGVSLAVHLLNLLSIPAIVLVYAYKRYPGLKLTGSLVALLISFVILYLVLYGLMPGFLKAAQVTELLFVNGFHLGFNSGALAYAIILTASILWALSELYTQRSEWKIKVSFILAVTLTGMLFLGSGVAIGIVLTIGLIVLMFWGFRKTGLPVRALNVIMWSIGVIFLGFSSYALILIRSSANTPVNENAPDNVFSLASYLNREQYGETPLLYGPTLYSSPQLTSPDLQPRVEKGGKIIAKGVKDAVPDNVNGFLSAKEINENTRLASDGRDHYIVQDYKSDYVMNPELNMIFPRLYSKQHADLYREWVDFDPKDRRQIKELSLYDTQLKENEYPDMETRRYLDSRGRAEAFKPSFKQNLEYFFNYQLNHMYMRYFLWNFVGRQNDISNQHGELDAGNWISGIPAIDNSRLGDQSLLPPYQGEENPGHNAYYFLPLLMGIIGLLWQSFSGRRGIEQFWVIFFLFFMTGIAIVLYLNQYPNQPRERDYAFAGSFYAFAIWIGMGVPALWRFLMYAIVTRKARGTKASEQPGKGQEEPEQSRAMTEEPAVFRKPSLVASIVAVALGICVPIQMVSQTWDDHDRSGRYAARDFAINYLESLEPNAIIFCNGDNDTFPLWYAQEVEGVRPDVRIINLSYLNSDWYANQHRLQSYDAAPAPFTSKPSDIAYGKHDITLIPSQEVRADLLQSLKALYAAEKVDPETGYYSLSGSIVSIPINKKLMVERGLVAPSDTALIVDAIDIDLRSKGYLTLGETLMLDIIATNAALGWPRPIYWATTVGHDNHVGLTPYLRSTGMAYQLTPVYDGNLSPRTDRAYANITQKYQWGTREGGKQNPYFDETARRMLYGMRNSVLDLAEMFYVEGLNFEDDGRKEKATEAYKSAYNLVQLLEEKVPARISYYETSNVQQLAKLYLELGEKLGNKKAEERGMTLLTEQMEILAKPLRYYRESSRYGSRLTYEMSRLPFDYRTLVNLYLDFGGNREYVDQVLGSAGWTLAELNDISERIYNHLTGRGNPDTGSSDMEDLQDFALQLITACEDIARMQELSPEEYAREPLEMRQIDSILEYYIQEYIRQGGSEADLEASEAFRKIDRQRSRRLLDAYMSSVQ